MFIDSLYCEKMDPEQTSPEWEQSDQGSCYLLPSKNLVSSALEYMQQT